MDVPLARGCTLHPLQGLRSTPHDQFLPAIQSIFTHLRLSDGLLSMATWASARAACVLAGNDTLCRHCRQQIFCIERMETKSQELGTLVESQICILDMAGLSMRYVSVSPTTCPT